MEGIWKLRDSIGVTESEIESYQFREVHESHLTADQSENATYQFHIQDTNANIFYSGGFLQQELKIVNDNNTPIGNDNVTLVNFGGLLRTSRMTLGKTEMEANIEYTSVLLHALSLINFTPDYSTSEATNMFCYIDTSETPDKKSFIHDGVLTEQTKITDFFNNLKPNASYNDGFTKRWIMTKNSNSVKIWIPLKHIFGFLNDYNKVLTGFQARFEFQRNNHQNMVYTDKQNPSYKVIASNLALWLPYIKFKPSIETAYKELSLSKDPITVSWCQPRIIKSNILENSSGSYSIPATSDEVLSLYVIPQLDERLDNANKNNMIFDNLNMVECWLTVSGRRYLDINYVMNFDNKDYSRVYASLLQAGLNDITTETGCLINYVNFGRLYPIFCFNLAHHESYVNLDNLVLEFNWRLKTDIGKKFSFFFILNEVKRCEINLLEKHITMLKTLKS